MITDYIIHMHVTAPYQVHRYQGLHAVVMVEYRKQQTLHEHVMFLTVGGGSPVQLLATPGDHVVDIRPLDPNSTCSQRQTLRVPYTV